MVTDEQLGHANPFEEYNEQIKALKNKPEILEFDKLCYLVFNTQDGKSLLEQFEKRFLIPALARLGSDNFSNDAVYYEGFKEGFRHIINCYEAHKQRIKNNNEENV